MSEKRFTTKNIICSNYCVWDNNDKPYGNDEVVVLLNEQQATINNQEQKIKILQQCSNCRNQMTGWDGGFFGEPLTCECRIHGVTKGRKSCSNFKKRVTKSDLLNKIQSLENEHERQNNEIKLLRKKIIELREDLEKIPPSIREVWLE